MFEQNIEELSDEQLRKRKRIIDVIIALMIGFLLITIISIILSVLNDESTSVFIGVFLVFPLFPVFRNRKRIMVELRRRGN